MEAFRALVSRYIPGARFAVSRHPGHEYRLAEEALEEGVELLVAVGGDGTWSHVADRILASGRSDVILGLLPSGTGNDFGRNLGLDYRDQEDAVERLCHGAIQTVDAGRILTPSRPAEPGKEEGDGERVRHFLNVVGVGFDVAVVEAAAGARFLKGELLYKVTALQQLFRYQGLPLGLEGDDDPGPLTSHLMLTITNGAYFGGGFPIAPGARVDDGTLHACIIRDASPLRRMGLFNRAEKGRHVDQPEVEIRNASRFHLRFGAPVRFEADGDLYTTSESGLTVEILPGALRVLGA